jgi:hypothetical protein
MGNADYPPSRIWYHYASQVRDLKVSFEWFRYERFKKTISPCTDNVDSSAERSYIESGLMVGPRIFSVGHVIYGVNERLSIWLKLSRH